MPKDNASLSKRILKGLEPLMGLVPEVPGPTNPINIKDKMMWTVIILFLYLVCSQIPLYGIQKMAGDDPLYWTRVILASNRGTLMELGISPLITSSMIMQVLAGTKIIEVDQSLKSDRDLYEAATKCILLRFNILKKYLEYL